MYFLCNQPLGTYWQKTVLITVRNLKETNFVKINEDNYEERNEKRSERRTETKPETNSFLKAHREYAHFIPNYPKLGVYFLGQN